MQATLKVFESVRRKIPVKNIGYHVPNDPGVLEYIAVFEAIVQHGSQALSWQLSGFEREVQNTFSFGETISLTRWGTPKTDEERWFRVLTSLCELLVWFDRGYGLRDRSFDSLTITLLHDLCMLDTSLELVGLFDEMITISPEPAVQIPPLIALLLQDLPTEHAETRCEDLSKKIALCEPFYIFGSEWEPNPHFRDTTDFVWGLFEDARYIPDWLHWIEERFPTATPTLREMKQELLESAEGWKNKRRRVDY